MRVLVTGGAGFIGAQVGRALQDRGDAVTVLDDFDAYYDPALKRARVRRLYRSPPRVIEADITDARATAAAFRDPVPDAVVHLAAWPGVRPSREHPDVFARANILGTVNVFEACRASGVRRIVFASSSSVYGPESGLPSREDAAGVFPRSGYGITKRTGEAYAALYHTLDGLPIVCLRFFTVYGPWGRPDMAVWKFTERVLGGQPLTLHTRSADGREVRRDFTEVSDIVRGILGSLDRTPSFALVNLGSASPVPLRTLVSTIEEATGKRAIVEERTLPAEEAVETGADLTRAKEILSFSPEVDLRSGVRRFVTWYEEEFRPLFPRGLAPSRFWT